ncbi:MAG: GLPGLI family protein [Maribacter sp.]|jgi:GLPGLI family protein
MKNLILFLLLSFPILIFAQTSSGKILYKEVITVALPDKVKDDPKNQVWIDKMPKTRESDRELFYFGEKSLYKNIKKEEAPNERKYMYDYQEPDNHYYIDIEADESVHLTDFFRKSFLVTGEHKERTWKMTKNQRMIKDYLCFEATAGDTTDQVIVWFTPQIKTTAAPMYLNGLPGLILEVSMNEGKFKLSASTITLNETKEEEIEKPTKGKKMTKEKYDEMVKKKTEEMKEQYGGNRYYFRG